MPPVKIDPMKLPGPWADGYVLERQHTLTSDFVGHDSFGNPQFDTKRSELGELVFRLKNRSDKSTLDSITETAVQFIQNWNPSFDLIVPVPPSRKRTYQPVVEIATAISRRLSKPVNTAAVNKIKETPELKDVYDYQHRIELLQGAFAVDRGAVHGRPVLLIDDLYRSGATATVMTQDLLAGGAAAVYLIAMTKTRTRT
jgi:predicted amidophosphoribosyltransferase